MVLIAVPYSA